MAAEVVEPAGDARGRALAAVIRGASVALLGSVLGGGLGFVFPVVMARVLPQSSFGLLVLALNLLVAAAALGTIGADFAAIRGVAAAGDAGAKRGAMRTPILLVLALDTAVAVALALLAGPLARHVFGQPSFVWPLRALAVVLPLTVLAQMFSASLSGLERASGELARKVVEQAGRVALAPLAVAAGLGVAGAILGMAVAAAAASAAVAWLLLRALPRGGTTRPVPVRGVVTLAWPQTIANGAAQLWQLANIVILGQYTSARVVALYGAALALARLPALVYNSFSFRFSPAIARLWTAGAHEELGDLLQSVTRWVSMVALPFYAIAVAVPGPLLLVYGGRYRSGALALALISLGSLANSLAGPVEWTLIMTGRVKLEMAANVGAALPLLGVAFWLIPRYGLTGAAITSLLYAAGINTAKTVFVARALHLHAFSPPLLRPLGAAAGAGALAAVAEHAGGIGVTLPGTLALAAIVIAVYVAALALLGGMSREDRSALALAVRGR
jgi:O-antigen/teichoic acid export membrane protein